MPTFEIQTEFIQGTKGRLYSIHYCPAEITIQSECFLVIPAFAEEMNRCRYMTTLFAQEIARLGCGYMSVDPYGTGDSEGDFGDTDWIQINTDLTAAASYLQKLGYGKISLLAIRQGALHAFDIANEIEGLNRILLWQPVINGQLALKQFLRIRMAAALSRGEQSESIKYLEEIVDTGRHVEVSGYELSPAHFKAMKVAKLDISKVENRAVPITWFTTVASVDRQPPKAEATLVNMWRESGVDVYYSVIVDPPYWQAHERTIAYKLIETTVSYIQADSVDD